MWPASAMLTGSGVALILRVPDTPRDDPWTTHAWYVFAGVAAFSLLTKYVIRYRGTHVFNPSNIGLVVAFVVLGSTRVEPLDFWWAPLEQLDDHRLRGHPRRRAADHRPPATPRRGGDVLDRPGRRRRAPRRLRALHDRPLGVRARLRVRLLAGDRHLPGGADLPVLHDHGSEDGAGRSCRPRRVRPPRRRGQHAADGAADRRVRDQGRPARWPGGRVRGSPAPGPAGSRAAIDGGRSRPLRQPG